jgi:hypothetical protein
MKYILSLFFLFFVVEASAQRMPFFGSLRQPTELTKFYGGFGAGISYSMDNTSIVILENQIECCKFETGATRVLSVNAAAEYWVHSQWSVGGNFGLSQYNVSMSKASDPVPRREKPPLITEYNGTIQAYSIALQPQSKYRFVGTNFSVGGAILCAIPFSNSATLTERDISDNSGNQPLFSEQTLNGFSYKIQPIVIEPSVFIGYDHALTNGTYLQTTVHSGYRPSLINNYDYTSVFFKLQCNYLFGL